MTLLDLNDPCQNCWSNEAVTTIKTKTKGDMKYCQRCYDFATAVYEQVPSKL